MCLEGLFEYQYVSSCLLDLGKDVFACIGFYVFCEHEIMLFTKTPLQEAVEVLEYVEGG